MAFVVGRILDVTGDVQVKNNASNSVRTIHSNDVVYQNETILTPSHARVLLELIDGRTLSLGGHLTQYSELVLSYLVPFDAIKGIEWDRDVTFDALKQAIQQNQLTPLSKFMQDLTQVQKLALEERLDLFQKTETLFDSATQPSSANHGAIQLYVNEGIKQDFFYQRLGLEGNVTAGYQTRGKAVIFKEEEIKLVEEEFSEIDLSLPAPQLILVGNSSVIEGQSGVYELVLDFAPNRPFTVTVEITHVSTEKEDVETVYQVISFEPEQLMATFSLQTQDDFLADSGELYRVSIVSTEGGGYFEQPELPLPVITEILDDSQPLTPYDQTDRLESDIPDVIEIKLYALNSLGERVNENQVVEGENVWYIAVAFDQEGIELNLQGSLNIQVNDVTATGVEQATLNNGSEDYLIPPQMITLGTAFQLETINDEQADSGEQFQIHLVSESYNQALNYEAIHINLDPVTTTIIDNSIVPDLGGEVNAIQFTLYGLDSSGERLANMDVNEGSAALYVVVATDEEGNELALDGTIQVQTVNGSATGVLQATQQDGSQDYINTLQTVSIGTPFSIKTIDDYLTENGHTFSALLVDESYSNADIFESIAIDTTPVLTTILDGDSEIDGGLSDADYIKLQLSGVTFVPEIDGQIINHTLSLVDGNGFPVNLPAGETIGITLNYINSAGLDASDFSSGMVSDFTITGNGGSQYSFSNIVAENPAIEDIESYTVSIAAITEHSRYFEHVVIDFEQNISIATILENLVLIDDTATISENGATVSDVLQGNLLANDIDLGQAGRITQFKFMNELGQVETAILTSGSATVDTQYGSLTIDELGTWQYTSDVSEDHSLGDLTDSITLTIVDSDGKSNTSNFDIIVTDTGPIAHNDNENSPRTVLESATAISGNVINNTTDSLGNDELAGDPVSVERFVYDDISGQSTTYVFGTQNDGVTLNGAYKTVLTQHGELTVTEDGSWIFQPNAFVDHSSGNVTANFDYTLKDSDGSTSSATQFISVIDGSDPTIGAVVNTQVDEENLPNGSNTTPSALIVEGSLTVITGTDTIDVAFIPSLTAPIGLTSGGVPVSYTLSNANHTLTAIAGSATVFTVEITDPTNTGAGTSYQFILENPLDHSSGLAENPLPLSFDFIVTDIDADTVSGNFTVTVIDDIPMVTPDDNPTELIEDHVSNRLNGNVFSNDDIGADSNTPITGVVAGNTGSDVIGNIGSSLEGVYGDLILNGDGSYDYTLNNSDNDTQAIVTDEAVTDIFTYTITDQDGDTATTTLTVHIKGSNDAPILDLDSDDSSTNGQNALTTFHEDGTAVSIADSDLMINDVDDTVLESAQIVLTNAFPNDVLDISGVDPKFSAVIDSSVPGQITINLTGTYSPADYQAAIQAITFSTPLQMPDETNRVIEITVNDGESDSNIALSTIQVNAKPDLLDNAIELVEGSILVDENSSDLNPLTVEGNLLINDESGTLGGSITAFTYFDESGILQSSGTIGAVVNTQYGSLVIESDGRWRYTSDATESQPNDVPVQDLMTYSFTDGNGDTETANFSVGVLDGADPIMNPNNQTVNESGLGVGEILTPVTVSESLGVTQGTDATTTKFATTQVDLEALNVASNGIVLTYTITDEKITALAGTTVVFEVTLTNQTLSSAGYDFTLYKGIDNAVSGSTESVWQLPFDVVIVDSDDNGIIGDGDDDSVQFIVNGNDSQPLSTPQIITMNEEDSYIIRVSQEPLSVVKITALDGVEVDISVIGTNTPIYDTNGVDVIGQLTNNGDGTFTFVPELNYSNYNTTPTFTYEVTDFDGDSSLVTTVTVDVIPVSDAPTIAVNQTINVLEDDNNTQEGSFAIPVGLILPVLNDQVDINGGSTGDNSERLGLISLAFNGGNSSVNGAIIEKADGTDLFTVNGSDAMSIYITPDGSANTAYHFTGLNPDAAGVVKLTQSEFESLRVIPTEDSDTNIDIAMTAVSHEVKDDGTLLDVDVSSSATQITTINILATTDAISLEWDDSVRGVISTVDYAGSGGNNNINNTYTFTTIDEGDALRVIDLQGLLSATSGVGGDITPLGGDLDGTEMRSYTLSGLPEGSVVTLNGNSVAVATGDSSVTIPFSPSSNVLSDPSFSLTLPEQYGGDIIAARITLNVTDKDSDSGINSATETAEVYFNINVNPVADIVTLQVDPAFGVEDDGRLQGNSTNGVSAAIIDDVSGGIPLSIAVVSDDQDGSENYTIVIESLPFDNDPNLSGHLYYNGIEVPLIEGDALGGSLGAGIGYIQISDFDNTAPLVFVPGHNSDVDYQFNVSAYSVETLNGDDSLTQIQSLPLPVVVEDVADIPIGNNLNSVVIVDDSSANQVFNQVVLEDSGNINLKMVFATPNAMDSYDSDGSESLTLKITNLPDEFNITGVGTSFLGGIGTSRTWFVDLNALQTDQVSLVMPEHFAGEILFDSILITTENAGDSATHPLQTISIMVQPDVDMSINLVDEQIEDVPKILNFDFIQPDNGNLSQGIETLQNFGIDMSTVDTGVVLTGSVSGVLDAGAGGYVALDVTAGVLEIVTATLPTHSAMNGSYDFNIQYRFQDQAEDVNGNNYSALSIMTNQLYQVTVLPVTDNITLTTDTTTVDVIDNTSFTKILSLTGDDQDSSEVWTHLEVQGVPNGVTVVDGSYAGDINDGQYSGLWYVDISPNKLIDLDGDSYDLTFNIDGEPVNQIANIIVTAFNEDSNNDVALSDSVSFDLNINNASGTWTGQTIGSLITIDSFVQDIDQDNLNDSSDADAFANSILREDVSFTLDQVIDVTTTNTGNFSITLKDVSADVLVTGATQTPLGFWTVSGVGGQADIIAKLASIQITPAPDINSNALDTANTNLQFDIELTSYATGGGENTAIINFDAAVLPVTDLMELTIVNDGLTPEDIDQTFSIQLNNLNDGSQATIVGDKIYLQMTEALSDIQGSDGVSGELMYDDGIAPSILYLQAVSGVSGLADGNYYIIESVSVGDTLNFIYSPPEDRDGSVSIDAFVVNLESEAWIPYETIGLVSTQTIVFDVESQSDGFVFDTTSVPTIGDEDTLIEVSVSVSNTDDSERLLSVALGNIPNGFLVYYGVDAGSAVLAQNTGVNGSTTAQLTYGTDEVVDVNLWNIPLNLNQIPGFIGIKAPENWSGTLTNLQFEATDINGSISTTPFNLEVSPVVDGISLNVSNTFGDAGDAIDINLNAYTQDLDGSETSTLTLTGIGAGAVFAANGINIPFTSTGSSMEVSYNSSVDTYTLTGIAAADLNQLTFQQTAFTGTVNVAVQMVEQADLGNPSSTITDTFEVQINQVFPTSGDDFLYSGAGDDLIDAGAGDDILYGRGGDDTLIGGTGADIFALTSFDQGSTDTIVDFEDGVDKLDITDVLEGAGLINDTTSLNEYFDFAQEGNHLRVIIDSNGESTAGGDVYQVLFENTLLVDFDETDVLD
ncbi:Alkaline phosphatase [hydrothermal vent metagenome]|uniref:Alkaline phosphatase n=1 Tax=hydrothermal vent metagenome TaxID=652676 RepID=A0A3B0WAL7_9ZZZZ